MLLTTMGPLVWHSHEMLFCYLGGGDRWVPKHDDHQLDEPTDGGRRLIMGEWTAVQEPLFDALSFSAGKLG